MNASVVALWLAVPAATTGDLRIPVVEMRLAGQPEAALAAVERTLSNAPEEARRVGLSYLRGRLLQDLGRGADAAEALGDALGHAEHLRPYARYRLALVEEGNGHPEVAAGLVAGVIAPEVPLSLLNRAIALLGRSLDAGGDCRVLRDLRGGQLPKPARRAFTVVVADCALKDRDAPRAEGYLRRLLDEDVKDEPARQAADRLDWLWRHQAVNRGGATAGTPLELLIGLTFHQHREYDRAAPYLETGIARIASGPFVTNPLEFEARYALARGYFFRDQFGPAVERYADLEKRVRTPAQQALVLYQLGRSLELTGDWVRAVGAYRRCHITEPNGEWAGASLFAAVRLEWRNGNEPSALHLYNVLAAHRGASNQAARAALFLASSEIVLERRGRAAAWLADALRLDPDTRLEVDYWLGRLAELSPEDPDHASRAVRSYLAVALRDPYHPLARSGLARTQLPALAAAAAKEGRRRAQIGTPVELFAAWLLLGDGDSLGSASRKKLLDQLNANPRTGPFYRTQTLPLAAWPLWRASAEDPETLLLALGLFDEGAGAAGRLFASGSPDLVLSVARRLADAFEVQRSLVLAEGLVRRIEPLVPRPLMPVELRRHHYPLGWPEQLVESSKRFGIDPRLLAAIIREESHFDPTALSAASARGLAQFVWMTARRLASAHGLGGIRPDDLYRPEVAIRLGAAYLGELMETSRGSLYQTVAAYNAGPAQAQLWQGYCYSTDPAEFFTKVSFLETRGYLRKVLSSRAIYMELYPELAPP